MLLIVENSNLSCIQDDQKKSRCLSSHRPDLVGNPSDNWKHRIRIGKGRVLDN